MYRVMLLRCRPCVDLFRHDKEIAPTRSVGRKLAHFVLCAPRAPSRATRAHDCAAALWAVWKALKFVLWFDTFYRHRFHPTPHESNTSLHCTAIVVALGRKAIEFLWGFPSLPTLQASTAQAGKLFTTTQSVFMSAPSDLMEDDIPPLYICCPLDVRPMAVQSTQWHPIMLSELQS